MDIIDSSCIIEKQSITELPTHLLNPADIDAYVTGVHDLAQYLINNPTCFISPSKINDGRIFRNAVPARLTKENYYLPALVNGEKTDPIWFANTFPGLEYTDVNRSDEWITTCIQMKDQQTKDGKNIGYNFYINFDGEDDDDIICKEKKEIVTKRLNIPLMKRLNDILEMFYKKDTDPNTKKIILPNYNTLRSLETTLKELKDTFSYEFGTRNSSYELDRYIANKMMIIFNNVQEVLQKQSTNIFITDTNNELSNKINIFGYYAGNIRFDIPMYPECDAMSTEVTVQSKYIDKRFIGEYFYERDEECKPVLISFSKQKLSYLGGKNNKNRITKKKRYSRKLKNRLTKYKKYKKYNMEPKKPTLHEIYMSGLLTGKDVNWNWMNEPDGSPNGLKCISPVKHAIYYHQGGGREKLLKYYHEKEILEMKEYINNHKGDIKELHKGYSKFDDNEYKALLKEAGFNIEPPVRTK
jgi:hypothetical protein